MTTQSNHSELSSPGRRTLTDAEHVELLAVVDAAAGRQHSTTGAVAATVRAVIERYEEMRMRYEEVEDDRWTSFANPASEAQPSGRSGGGTTGTASAPGLRAATASIEALRTSARQVMGVPPYSQRDEVPDDDESLTPWESVARVGAGIAGGLIALGLAYGAWKGLEAWWSRRGR